ncbi:MAG: hypothetical protein ACRYHA_14390 [Janthinobacterium lividum]
MSAFRRRGGTQGLAGIVSDKVGGNRGDGETFTVLPIRLIIEKRRMEAATIK